MRVCFLCAAVLNSFWIIHILECWLCSPLVIIYNHEINPWATHQPCVTAENICQRGGQYYIQDAMHALCGLSHSSKSEPQFTQSERDVRFWQTGKLFYTSAAAPCTPLYTKINPFFFLNHHHCFRPTVILIFSEVKCSAYTQNCIRFYQVAIDWKILS